MCDMFTVLYTSVYSTIPSVHSDAIYTKRHEREFVEIVCVHVCILTDMPEYTHFVIRSKQIQMD